MSFWNKIERHEKVSQLSGNNGNEGLHNQNGNSIQKLFLFMSDPAPFFKKNDNAGSLLFLSFQSCNPSLSLVTSAPV